MIAREKTIAEADMDWLSAHGFLYDAGTWVKDLCIPAGFAAETVLDFAGGVWTASLNVHAGRGDDTDAVCGLRASGDTPEEAVKAVYTEVAAAVWHAARKAAAAGGGLTVTWNRRREGGR